MTDKEFNLKEERKGRLKSYLEELDLHRQEVANIMIIVLLQDEEFISRLKKLIWNEMEYNDEISYRELILKIDKLSGEKFEKTNTNKI